MATNKHAFIRYRAIDECLQKTNQQWNWASLAIACQTAIYRATGQSLSLSERTIKADLQAMRSDTLLGFNAPIIYDRSRKSYLYTQPGYSIYFQSIKKGKGVDLDKVVNALQHLSSLKKVFGVQNILTKLRHGQNNRKQIVQFDHLSESVGEQWLYELYQRIENKETTTINYNPFGRSKASHILSPYLLKEYQHRWYLVAFSHKNKQVRTYALDRISGLNKSLAEFITDDSFDGDHYFNNVVGITLDPKAPVDVIQFEAYDLQINYLITKPIHGSQKLISQADRTAIFQIEVVINYELISELAMMQANIKVLTPSSLVSKMREIINQLSKLYEVK